MDKHGNKILVGIIAGVILGAILGGAFPEFGRPPTSPVPRPSVMGTVTGGGSVYPTREKDSLGAFRFATGGRRPRAAAGSVQFTLSSHV